MHSLQLALVVFFLYQLKINFHVPDKLLSSVPSVILWHVYLFSAHNMTYNIIAIGKHHVLVDTNQWVKVSTSELKDLG